MSPDDVLGLLFLFEGLVVLWGVLFSFAAVRTVLRCCRGAEAVPPAWKQYDGTAESTARWCRRGTASPSRRD